jgi:putative ubiquitin-RnfH superfamily antitoxin RatB of RatAB toxin-antitoxin module
VQVVYATAAAEYLRSFEVEQGTTIEQAIRACGILQDIPGIDLGTQPVGIYGKKRALDTVLRAHDRIEIYRPLVADPKETRRLRANKKTASEGRTSPPA